MAVVVIGGHSRSVGKTSVVAGLIAALPSYHWTAFKVTQFGHGRCSRNGQPCHCATADHLWAISEERGRSGKSDSSRFLVAGAEHSFWVRTAQGQLGQAMPAIRRRLDQAKNSILESNSILKFIQPDLYITVLDPATEDFKGSAQEFLGRADAVVLHHGKAEHRWTGVTLASIPTRPVFAIHPPQYVNPALVEFVRDRLQSLPAAVSVP